MNEKEDAYWDFVREDEKTFLITCDSQKTRDVMLQAFRKNFLLKNNQLKKQAALSLTITTRNHATSIVLENGLIFCHAHLTKMRNKEKKGSLWQRITR